MSISSSAPVLVTGASGQLGGYLLRQLSRQGASVVAWSGSRTGQLFGYRLRPVQLDDRDQLVGAFRQARPRIVIHAGAMSRVDQCFLEAERARQINAAASQMLAELSADASARLVFVSSDLVFDGRKGWYREADATAPLSLYGQTKVAAEKAVLAHQRGVVLRVSLLFGPTIVGRPSFFDQQIAALRQRRPCTLFADEWRTPLSLLTAASGILAVARSDVRGLLHLGGPQRMTRLEMGQRLAAFLGTDPSVLQAARRADTAAPEPRPRDTSLDSSLWRHSFPHQDWPSWDEALARLLR